MPVVIHPVCFILPGLKAERRAALKESILKYGCQMPVVLWQGKVIDGRHRISICLETNTPYPTKEFEGTEEEAIAFAWSINDDRRHLSTAERAFAGVELDKLLSAAAKERQKSALQPGAALPLSSNDTNGENTEETTKTEQKSTNAKGRSSTRAAKTVGVSPVTVARAKAIDKNGTPKLKEAVKSGAVSLADGVALSRATPEVQDAAVEAAAEGDEAKVKEIVARPSNGKLPKSGSPVFDDRSLTNAFGKLIRLMNDRGNILGKTQGYRDLDGHLNNALTAWGRWQLEKERK